MTHVRITSLAIIGLVLHAQSDAAPPVQHQYGICQLNDQQATRDVDVSVVLGCDSHDCDAAQPFNYVLKWIGRKPPADAVGRVTFHPYNEALHDAIRVFEGAGAAERSVAASWDEGTLQLQAAQEARFALSFDPDRPIRAQLAIELSGTLVSTLNSVPGRSFDAIAALELLQTDAGGGSRATSLHWNSGYCPFGAATPDRVTFSKQKAGEFAVAVVNSSKLRPCAQDRVGIAPFGAFRVPLGDLGADQACAQRVSVASRSARFEVLDVLKSWQLERDDEVPVTVRKPVALDLAFWVVHGEFGALSLAIQTELAVANETFAREHSGIQLRASHIYDATGVDRGRLPPVITCDYKPQLEKALGMVPGVINVYYVEEVSGSRGCSFAGPALAIDVGEKLVTTLGHEIGHALSLGHTDYISSVSPLNAMMSGENTRGVLTLGQVQRANLSACSAVNVLQAREGDVVGWCPFTRCPGVNGSTPVNEDTVGCFPFELDWRVGSQPSVELRNVPDVDSWLECADCGQSEFAEVVNVLAAGTPRNLESLRRAVTLGLPPAARAEYALELAELHARVLASGRALPLSRQQFVDEYLAARDRDLRRKAATLLHAIRQPDPQRYSAYGIIWTLRRSTDEAVKRALAHVQGHPFLSHLPTVPAAPP